MPSEREIYQLLRHFQVPTLPNAYVLGLFEPSITVASQQVRAINLVKAVFELGLLRREQRLVVVGAGAGGLTVAAAAAERGAAVTILEKEKEPLSILRRNTTRWLFPYRYEWPRQNWDAEHAGLEVLSWRAAQVQDVVRTIEFEWDEIRRRTRIEDHYGVEQVAVSRNAGGRPLKVSWVEHNTHRLETTHAVVFAVGFGKEQSAPGGPSTYWDNDNFDRIGNPDDPIRCLISGNGDGAVVDALRIRLDFQQQHFFDDFLDQQDLAAVENDVREIERLVKAQVIEDRLAKQERRASKSWAWLTDRYLQLPALGIDRKLRAKLRDGTEVVLNGLTEKVLSPSMFPVNRLLISRFFKEGRAWGMRYVPGQLELPREVAMSYRIDAADPSGRPFHHVLIRRGPGQNRPLERDFEEIHRLTANERALSEGEDSRNRYFWRDHETKLSTKERDIEDLCLALAETRDVVAAMGCLLRTCLRHETELSTLLETAVGYARVADLHRRARSEFGGWAEDFQEDEAERLAAFVRAHAGAAAVVLVARSLATALDELYGRRFLDIFQSSLQRRGLSGEALLRVAIRPLEVFPLPHRSSGTRLRAEKHADTWHATRTNNMRLGSPFSWRTLLEVRRFVDLTLPDEGQLGVVVPARASDLTWGVDHNRTLFGVEPRDASAFRLALEELLALALERRARMLVLPELVCAPNVVDDVFRIVTTHPTGASPLVVAIGSHHYEEGAPNCFPRHRSVVLVAGSRCEQGKVSCGQYLTPEGPCAEAVVADEELVVHAGGRGGSLAVALGSDLPALAEQLEWLSPSVVLVPASVAPDAVELRRLATNLAVATCATVVVGHLTASEPGAEAFIHSPLHSARRAQGAPPILFLTEPGTPQISSTFPPSYRTSS